MQNVDCEPDVTAGSGKGLHMHIILRLYRMHDYDIMLLKYNRHINFSRTVRSMLRSFADNKIYNIDYSEVVYDIDPKNIPYKSQLVINFDEEKDKKVIEMLLNIKDGYRNSFIRDVIRLYMSTFFISQYQIEKRTLPTISIGEPVKPFKKKENRHDAPTEGSLAGTRENKGKTGRGKDACIPNANLLPGTNRLNPTTAAKTAGTPKENESIAGKRKEQTAHPAVPPDRTDDAANTQPKTMPQLNAQNPFSSSQPVQDDFDFFKNLM